MKKKVLIILPNLSGGGAERVIVTLLNNFDREKAEYFFIAVNKKGPYVNDLPSDIKIIDFGIQPFFMRPQMFQVQRKLVKEINKIKPDVILTTLTEMNITLLSVKSLLKGSPKIIIRETNPPSPRWHGLKRKIIKRLYVHMYPKADKVIAISEGVKSDLIEFSKLVESQVQVIYNPLPIRDIQKKSILDLEKIKFPKDRFNIVSIGRLSEQKDFTTLIKAVNIVRKKHAIQLTILGEGREYANLKKIVEDLDLRDNIKFEGFKSNPYPYLKKSDLFVLSSKWEGFGLVIVEALATGTQVISTESNGAPKEILSHGKYGILTPVGDEKKLASAIIKVLNKENMITEDKLKERASTFDVSIIAEEYLKLLLRDENIN